MATSPTPPLDRQTAARMILGFKNHEKFCEESIRIRAKTGSVVPFKTFPGPRKLDRAIREQQNAGKPVKIIYLKARRVFVSAAIATQIWKNTAFMSGQHAMVVAHNGDSAKEIFDYYVQYTKGYQPFGAEWETAIELPKIVKHNEDYLEWANKSYVQVATANSSEIGRGKSIRFGHWSEIAFWRDPVTVLTALRNCIPDDPGTMEFEESTANGASGYFYEHWQEVTDPQYRGDWKAIFLGWNEHPENQRPLTVERKAFQDSMSREEHEMMAQHRLTFEQLEWRRWTIINKCQGSVKIFMQEHPINPEECFLVTGRPRFDFISLGRMPIVRDPIVGRLQEVDLGTRKMVQFIERRSVMDSACDLVVYRKPEPGGQYIIGADSAEGIDASDRPGESDTDYASATVLDQMSGEQVAKLRERYEPGYFGECVALLGRWYNWAYLVPEVNNTGVALIQRLLDLQYPIDRIYHRNRRADDRRPPTNHELGFKTDVVTRPQLIGDLDTAIREMAVLIHDANTLAECRSFVYKSNGRVEAKEGGHDDDVFSLALAVAGLRTAPKQQPRMEQAQQWKPVKYGRRDDDDDD